MLETIFRGNANERRQAETDLRDLLAELRRERADVRAEREAFAAQIEKSGGAMAKISRTNKALDDLSAKAEAALRKVDSMAELAASYDERARRVEKLDQRVAALFGQLDEAHKATQALLGPEGHLHQHRTALEDLGAQARDTQAGLSALRQQNADLGQVHAHLLKSTEELRQSLQGMSSLKGELGEMRKAEADLQREMASAREIAGTARADAEQAAAAAREVAQRFESLAQLQDASKDTEKRIVSLHALAEHVSAKAKALETQRHAVDHASAETARLGQMVAAMDTHIARLTEGHEKIQRTEEAVSRIEQLAQAATAEMATATAAREEFARESARLDNRSRTLLGTLHATVDKLALEKEEFGAIDERLKSLSATLADAEMRMQTVLAKDDRLSAMQHKAESLQKVFSDLRGAAKELSRKHSSLDTLAEQLELVEAMGRRTAAQQASLDMAKGDLQAMRTEVAELHKSFTDASRLREGLAADRSALEAFAERMGTMIGRTPQIEAQVQALLAKMAQVEEGQQAARRLGETATTLSAELERVAGRMQFVETVGERINALFATSTDVERRMAALTARRGEIEGLTQECDSLSAQIVLAQQQLEGVSAQQARLTPLAAEVAKLEDSVQAAQRSLATMAAEETAARQRQSQLAELVEQGVQQAADTTERLRQVRALGDELAQVSERRETVLAELAQVQERQRDVLSQVTLIEAQAQQAQGLARQIDQRRTMLVQTEKALANFEARLDHLDRHTEDLDQKMMALAERETLVAAVKAEVDGIRQLAGRSKADLQFVAEHRQDVSSLRGTVDDLLSRIGDTDDKIVLIETWRKKVEEVQADANAVTGLLSEVQGTLENLSEQRVVIDDVSEKLARLDFTVQEATNTLGRLDTSAKEAQTTLRTLQREREVAERVEKSIKAVRARGSMPAA